MSAADVARYAAWATGDLALTTDVTTGHWQVSAAGQQSWVGSASPGRYHEPK